ncbi:MAG: alcohol dehydrogenase catalytic domain-containing protein [Candidatus Dormibacteraeota bacterium]|nr:alcohol dehydrogenase catalytic domain-containing protein [Candidatus Dormibacteraeota bacterium]
MKALVWHGPSKLSLDEVPEPRPSKGQVLVSSEAAGICGSEIEGYLGRMSNRKPPLVMGHEFAGTVSEIGEGVESAWLGKRVAVNPIVGCGSCVYCSRGDRNLCPDRHLIGIAVPGGFAGTVAVPESCLFEMPAGMDPRLGALVEPLANGVHAIRKGAPEGATRAVVIGAGTIGLGCMQAALLHGIEMVVVLERHPTRRQHALALGAHEAYQSGDELKPGVDLVLDAAGAEATRNLAIDLLAPAGTAVFIGLHDDQTALPWHRVIRGNHTVKGVFGYSDGDFQRALDWLAAGRAGIGDLKPTLPLSDGPKAFATLAEGPTDDIKVFLGG